MSGMRSTVCDTAILEHALLVALGGEGEGLIADFVAVAAAEAGFVGEEGHFVVDANAGGAGKGEVRTATAL